MFWSSITGKTTQNKGYIIRNPMFEIILNNLEKGLKREIRSLFHTEKHCFSSMLENEILAVNPSKCIILKHMYYFVGST